MTKLIIVSIPFTYTFGPSLAPALLKACVQKQGIESTAWDLSAEFNCQYAEHEFYDSLVTWFQHPEITLTKEEFDWYSELVAGYADKIRNAAQFVALSLLTQSSHRFAEDLAFHIKSKDPGYKIIIGGNGTDIFQYQHQKPWHELMLESGLVDTVILGEGEFALGDSIKNNARGVVKVPQLSNQELDLIPTPDYSDYNFAWYPKNKKTFWSAAKDRRDENDTIFLVTASKGCVKNCNFCDVGKIWNKFRFRNGHLVANEIIELHEKYGATYFSFTDSLINGGLKTFFDLNLILAQRLPNKLKYEGQMICRGEKEMPEKYFQAMAEAGEYHVNIGMESGSEEVRIHMGKGSSQEDIAWTTSMCTKYNIRQSWNIIVGYVTETDEDWQQTMNLLKYWLPRTKGLLTINSVDTFKMLEGTPIIHMQDQLQISNRVVRGYQSFAWTTGLNPANTFDARANRYVELCTYLMEHDPVTYAYLDKKILNIERLKYWNDNDAKKISSFDHY